MNLGVRAQERDFLGEGHLDADFQRERLLHEAAEQCESPSGRSKVVVCRFGHELQSVEQKVGLELDGQPVELDIHQRLLEPSRGHFSLLERLQAKPRDIGGDDDGVQEQIDVEAAEQALHVPRAHAQPPKHDDQPERFDERGGAGDREMRRHLTLWRRCEWRPIDPENDCRHRYPDRRDKKDDRRESEETQLLERAAGDVGRQPHERENQPPRADVPDVPPPRHPVRHAHHRRSRDYPIACATSFDGT